MLPSDKSSNCVLFCFASRVLWLISFATDVSSSFVRAYVWFIVFADMNALRFSQSFARSIHLQKAHYLSRVSLEDRQVNVWRSERHFAFNDHKHTLSLSTSFDSVMRACAAGIVWENRFQIVRRRHIDLFTSEWHICIFCPILIVVSTLRVSTPENGGRADFALARFQEVPANFPELNEYS